MHLFLFRHGIAEDYAESDFQRNLTPKGVAKLLEQVDGLLNSGFSIDKILSSPYNRAIQTAEILSKGLSVPLAVADILGCGCHFSDFTDFLEAQTSDLKSVLCVGHQPDLGNITYKFTGRQAFVHKGSLIHIQVADWISHGGSLKGVYEPEQQITMEQKSWF
jgi:phosphohistidine phosphatase